MRIIVKGPNHPPIFIGIPTLMLFNGLTAGLGAKILRKYVKFNNMEISPKVAREMAKLISQYRMKHGRLELIRVDTHDDEHVQITL